MAPGMLFRIAGGGGGGDGVGVGGRQEAAEAQRNPHPIFPGIKAYPWLLAYSTPAADATVRVWPVARFLYIPNGKSPLPGLASVNANPLANSFL